jgi:hypothetical protein
MEFEILSREKARAISESMLDAIIDTKKEGYKLNRNNFSKFLDLNPIIRTIFLRAINP